METKPKASKERAQPVNIGVLEACLIGLVAALAAVVLKNGVGIVGSLRVAASADQPLFLPLIGLAGGVIAGLLMQYIVPEASGSGIPQTKAALNGVPMPMGLRVAAVKLLGCIASLGSGLSLGREGPTIHVAAALSSKLSYWIRTSPAHRNQLIAAGAGAGLAAAFNAPLAGVLFVLEELLQKMSGLAVGTTVVACFVASVTSRLVGVHSLDVNFSELAPKGTFSFIDIPFVLLLGVAAGIIGSLFNKCIIAGLTFNRDIIRQPLSVTCGLAGLLSGFIVMVLPDIFGNYAQVRQLLVEEQLDAGLVFMALVAQFVLTIIGYGSGAPGGLFAPSLTMGACLGHLVALFEQSLISTGDTGTLAVVGMGALFCAVARVPMTSVVIIFEMTTDFNVVLPLMISCVISYLVAERLDPGSLYDQLLNWNGINLKDEDAENAILSKLPARKFMQKTVETLSLSTTLQEAHIRIESSSHNGFPVVDEENKPVGMVSKPDLLRASTRKMSPDTPIERVMTPKPITVRPDETLAGILYLIEKYKISRLPVVDRGHLVGIITRSDVLSAESKIIGMRTTPGSASYVVYQTRSAESGAGRLVVAVGDPQQADNLLRVAALIAQKKNYELECLHVIIVPKEKDPAETQVSASIGRKIADQAESLGNEFGIPIHTNIRVAHDLSIAVTETISDRDANLFLMRWTGSKRANKGDEVLQKVLCNTNCPVLLISKIPQFDESTNFIVPVGDFVEHELSLELASHMKSKNDASMLYLCNLKPQRENAELDSQFETVFETYKRELGEHLKKMEIEATSPVAMLSTLSKDDICDVLVFGMPRKSLLKSIQKGSFKKTLNRAGDCSLLISAGQYKQVYRPDQF
ncbi:MAG: chloride channel protein [Candidatus Obscuribacterales bacterium]|nr:chloride channel protein [Candidatus Obscuribacterales bacterium]